jgi:ribonucleoside-diphosphate reductase alpha chain
MEMFPVPKSVIEGQIIKVKAQQGTRYDFRYMNAYGYENTLGGLSRMFNKEYWNYARLISGMLRNQIETSSVIEIIESMHSDTESLHSWKNGVIRALKTFVKDGTKTTQKCPCGGDIIYTGGCKECKECGWSQCS